MTLVAWQCRTLRRRRERAKEVDVPSEAGAGEGGRSPEDEAIARLWLQEVEALVEGMSEADRETLRAAFSDSAPEVPAATFRKRRERAFHRLRALWGARDG